MLKKFVRFIKNPKKELHAARELLRRTSFYYLKKFYEALGIDAYSKPYRHNDGLINLIGGKDGFFVQCGGNDGYFQDPTYYLEKFRNWQGLIVEPLPLYKKCQENRPSSAVLNFAAGTRAQSHQKIVLIDCGPMSMVKENVSEHRSWAAGAQKVMGIIPKEIEVESRTLDEMIEEYFKKTTTRKIDLLVIDVEGAEMAVLNGFSIEKYRPTYIPIELNSKEGPDAMKNMLHGYELSSHLGDNDYLYKSSL